MPAQEILPTAISQEPPSLLTQRMHGVSPGTVDIYALCDPVTGKVRYIGKAGNAENRFVGHLRNAHAKNTPVYCWIRKLAADGACPLLVVLEIVPTADWESAERRIIAEYRLTGDLLNLAAGGNQPKGPARTKRNGKLAAEKRVDTPLKARTYFLKREIGRELKAGRVSESGKEKLRYAARKRPDLFGIWLNI